MIRARSFPLDWPFRQLHGPYIDSRRRASLFEVMQGESASIGDEEDRDRTAVTWLNGLEEEVRLYLTCSPTPLGTLHLTPNPDTASSAYRSASTQLESQEPTVLRRLLVATESPGAPSELPPPLLSPLRSVGYVCHVLEDEALANAIAQLIDPDRSGCTQPYAWIDRRGTGSAPPQSALLAAEREEAPLARGMRDWRHLVRPASLREYPDLLEVGDAYLSVLELGALPREIGSEALRPLIRQPWPGFMVWMVRPLPADEVVRYLSRRIRDLRSGELGTPGARDMFREEAALRDAESLREALYLGQTRLYQIGVYWVLRDRDPIRARNLARTAIQEAARHMFAFRIARYRQRDAWLGLLPGAVWRQAWPHNVTTEAASCLVPFAYAARPLQGPWVAVNLEDRTPLTLDRRQAMNPANLYLGSPGSGKSCYAKTDILRNLHNTQDQGIVVDPEGEYAPVVRHLGGVVLQPGSRQGRGLNMLDLPRATAAERAEHASDLIAFLEPLLGQMDAAARGRLHRALSLTLQDEVPKFPSVVERLKHMEGDTSLADSLQYLMDGPIAALTSYTGSTSLSRVVSLDLRYVDPALVPTLAPLLTELLWRRMGRGPSRLWITLDEMHLYLSSKTGQRLLARLFKRARKRAVVVTGVTQSASDLLRSEDGKVILAGASRILLFKPGPGEQDLLARTFRLGKVASLWLDRLGVGEALWLEGASCLPVRTLLTPDELALVDTRPPTGGDPRP